MDPDKITCPNCRLLSWTVFVVGLLLLGFLLAWGTQDFSSEAALNFVKNNLGDILKVWVPATIAICIYWGGERSKHRERIFKAKLDTYLNIWGDWAKTCVLINRTPDADKKMIADAMELYSVSWAKALLIAPSRLQEQIHGIGAFLRENYIPIIGSRMSQLSRGEGVSWEEHFWLCRKAAAVATELRKKIIPIAMGMREELGTSAETETFLKLFEDEVCSAERDIVKLIDDRGRLTALQYLWNHLGNAITGEVVSEKEKWSVTLTEGGFAILNPKRGEDENLLSYHLYRQGGAKNVQNGEVWFKFEAMHPNSEVDCSLIITTFGQLAPAILNELREIRPWLSPYPCPMTQWQLDTLAKIPAAYSKAKTVNLLLALAGKQSSP